MLQQITPLILTYNEAPNIGRVLERLDWARDIVVVDSFSDDETLEIISGFPRVRLFQRKFDRHDRQWNFGLKETGIQTGWVMALDADFILTPEATDEIGVLHPTDEVAGFRVPLVFHVNGHRLRSALCPPVTVLYRRQDAEYFMDGHTQRLKLKGRVDTLRSSILHDDRKAFSRWFDSQNRYQQLEAKKILTTPVDRLDFADRVRRMRLVAPPLICFYCLIVRGGIFDGLAGWLYAFQRTIAELMLSLFLLEADLKFHQPAVERETAGPEHLLDFEERL